MDGIRIGVLGNVDAAKTTTISVLKHNELDNGRGSARSKLFKHKHEIETGRSSSVNHTHINLNNHIVTYVDLAGHERYLKTTMFGLNACSIDYALILVGANMGVLHMTKEHFKLAHALNIPIIFVVTKIDICPENILHDTMSKINKLIKQGYKKTPKMPYVIDNRESLNKCKSFPYCLELVKDTNYKNIIPIFKISNTKGTNVDLLKEFINNLPPMINYSPKKRQNRQNMSDYLIENGSIYIFKTKLFSKYNSRLFGKIGGYEMKKISIYEIDDPSDIGEFKKILTIYPKLKWKK